MATSTFSGSGLSRGPSTSTTPKLAPTATVRRNSRRTSSGRALGGDVVILGRSGRAAHRARSRRPRAPDGRPLAMHAELRTHARCANVIARSCRLAPSAGRGFLDPDQQLIAAVAALLPVRQLRQTVLARLLLRLHHQHRIVRHLALQVGDQRQHLVAALSESRRRAD